MSGREAFSQNGDESFYEDDKVLVYAVVSPNVFKAECFNEAGYDREVRQFFEGLFKNTRLIIDSDGRLLRDIENVISELPMKYRQFLDIYLDDLLKNCSSKTNRIVIKADREKCQTHANQKSSVCCKLVANATSPDALFIAPEEIAEFGDGGAGLNVESMANYTLSDFERLREEFICRVPYLDKLNFDEFAELMRRATRFSVWIRIFDPQIGNGTNLSNFRNGIAAILRAWVDNAHFPPDFVEIITRESEPLEENTDFHNFEEKRANVRRANGRIRDDLVKPLEGNNALKVRTRIKQDPNKDFHARHLQTQYVNILFERGFDFLGKDGAFRRCKIFVDLEADHLNEMHKLPACSEPVDELSSI